MKSPDLTIQFGGQKLLLDGSGALWWPAQRLLVVSDMHLEKSTFLASHGSLIPPYDTQDTLDRLEQRIDHYQPRELILLGDSFHDRFAWARLPETIRRRILAIASRVEQCVWLEGNHDIHLQGHALQGVAATRELEGLLFSHEHAPSALPQIIGHYHPKLSLKLRTTRVRGKCFVQGERLLIMPSFGSYTGGLDIADPAFDAVMGEAVRRYYLLHGGNVRLVP